MQAVTTRIRVKKLMYYWPLRGRPSGLQTKLRLPKSPFVPVTSTARQGLMVLVIWKGESVICSTLAVRTLSTTPILHWLPNPVQPSQVSQLNQYGSPRNLCNY